MGTEHHEKHATPAFGRMVVGWQAHDKARVTRRKTVMLLRNEEVHTNPCKGDMVIFSISECDRNCHCGVKINFWTIATVPYFKARCCISKRQMISR